MKKLLALFIALILVFSMLPEMAFAEGEDGVVVEALVETDPGLLPDSPFYFLKTFVETIKVIFTFNEDSRTDLLAELVDLRALELVALEEKYADGELTDKQQKMLDRTATKLEKSAEKLIDRLLGEGTDLDEIELTDKQILKLEKALDRMGKALDRVIKAEAKGDCEECEQLRERYQERITRLEQIRDKNPEAAEKGLTRAIENAYRQQSRWQERQEGEPNQGENNANHSNSDNNHNEDNNNNGNNNGKTNKGKGNN